MSSEDLEFELETARFICWKNYYNKKIVELKLNENKM